MLNGDGFSKQFGGASGDDPDWLRLDIIGMNGQSATGTVPFYLADYRFADNSQDYVVSDWTWVDLSALGPVTALMFDLSSTDMGPFGMNTPAYFVMDDLTSVPTPAAGLLLASGLLAVAGLRRPRS
jgi:hypothetical protein